MTQKMVGFCKKKNSFWILLPGDPLRLSADIAVVMAAGLEPEERLTHASEDFHSEQIL